MKSLCTLVLLCASSACLAQDAGQTLHCNPRGTQPDMNDCARRDHQSADAALNITYASVMERLPSAKRVELRKEQRAWLAGRDAACKAEARPSEGGSMWALEFYSCLQASTQRRTEKVRAW